MAELFLKAVLVRLFYGLTIIYFLNKRAGRTLNACGRTLNVRGLTLNVRGLT